MYSLGIDAADEADASHWFSVLQERVESCRAASKDCDDEEDGAINMTSLPLMNGDAAKTPSFDRFDIIQDHKSSVAEHMQHDVEPVFSFATVTVKHNLNEKQQDALRELIAIINSDVETVTLKSGDTVHVNKSTVRFNTFEHFYISDNSILSRDENPYDTLNSFVNDTFADVTSHRTQRLRPCVNRSAGLWKMISKLCETQRQDWTTYSNVILKSSRRDIRSLFRVLIFKDVQ